MHFPLPQSQFPLPRLVRIEHHLDWMSEYSSQIKRQEALHGVDEQRMLPDKRQSREGDKEGQKKRY